MDAASLRSVCKNTFKTIQNNKAVFIEKNQQAKQEYNNKKTDFKFFIKTKI